MDVSSLRLESGEQSLRRKWAFTSDVRLARPHIGGTAAFAADKDDPLTSGEDDPTAASELDSACSEFVRFKHAGPLREGSG